MSASEIAWTVFNRLRPRLKVKALLLTFVVCLSQPSISMSQANRERFLNPLNFRLIDQNGVIHTLSNSATSKAIILIGISASCEISPQIAREIEHLTSRFKNAAIFPIDPDLKDTPKNAADLLGTQHSVLMDDLQLVASSYGIDKVGKFTWINPEDFSTVMTGDLISDQTRLFAKLDQIMPSQDGYLDRVFTSVMASYYKLRFASTQCSFTANTTPIANFDPGVLRIFQKACNNCHQESPSRDYFKSMADIHGWSNMIEWTLRMRQMPPSVADPYYGDIAQDYSSENLRKILQWVKSSPSDDATDDPLHRFIANQHSEPARKPDYVFKMSKPQIIPAEGEIDYKYVQLAGPLAEDLWADSYKVLMNFGVVHHADIIISDRPLPETKDSHDHGMLKVRKDSEHYNIGPLEVRQERFLFGGGVLLPDGVAYFIPKGSYLIAELHYQPSGREEINQGSISFHRYQSAKTPQALKILSLNRFDFTLQPKENHRVVSSRFTVKKSMKVYFMGPHMHLRGQSFSVTLIAPDGSQRKILSVPFYDFRHTRVTWNKPPLVIQAGSTLQLDAVFDNSDANLANPDPNRKIPAGPQTASNEMCELRIGYVDSEEPTLTKTAMQAN